MEPKEERSNRDNDIEKSREENILVSANKSWWMLVTLNSIGSNCGLNCLWSNEQIKIIEFMPRVLGNF